MPPHSLTMTMIGASLLWVGWFGFNAGSNLEANGVDRARLHQHLRRHRGGGGDLGADRAGRATSRPSLLGAATGVVAGLVAITPAAGFAAPVTAIVLGAGRLAGLLLLRHHGEEQAQVRRHASTCSASTASAASSARSAPASSPTRRSAARAGSTTPRPVAVAGEYDMAAQVITQIKAVG